MSRYDLDLLPLYFELLWSFGCHVFKLCVRFEQNRTIRCGVINDLAIYFREGGCSKLYCSEEGGPISAKFGVNGVPSSAHPIGNFGSDILLRFEMTAAQKRVMSKSLPNFTLFDPL